MKIRIPQYLYHYIREIKCGVFISAVLKVWYKQRWAREMVQRERERESRWLFTSEVFYRHQTILYGICVEYAGPGADFSQGSSAFPFKQHSTNAL